MESRVSYFLTIAEITLVSTDGWEMMGDFAEEDELRRASAATLRNRRLKITGIKIMGNNAFRCNLSY